MGVEVQPKEKFTLQFESLPELGVQKPTTLKQLVRDLTKQDNAYYHRFWSTNECGRFLQHVSTLTEVIWSPSGEKLTEDRFWSMYDKYNKLLDSHPTVEGIALSWFEGWKYLNSKGH